MATWKRGNLFNQPIKYFAKFSRRNDHLSHQTNLARSSNHLTRYCLQLCTNLPLNSLLTSLRCGFLRKWKTQRSRCNSRRVPASYDRVAAACAHALRLFHFLKIGPSLPRRSERSSSAGPAKRRRSWTLQLGERTRIRPRRNWIY